MCAGSSAVVHRSRTAGRLPAHASSCGLVLLAHAPRHVREAYLRGPLAAFTEHTTTDPTILRRMLQTAQFDVPEQLLSIFEPERDGMLGVRHWNQKYEGTIAATAELSSLRVPLRILDRTSTWLDAPQYAQQRAAHPLLVLRYASPMMAKSLQEATF